ncbi:MAG: hypothetical protein ACRCZP_04125, partial [Phycicoccus sp.]
MTGVPTSREPSARGASPERPTALDPGRPHPPAAVGAGRDRVVDGVRAAAIVVVVVWHTTLSLLHVGDGRLLMPGP